MQIITNNDCMGECEEVVQGLEIRIIFWGEFMHLRGTFSRVTKQLEEF